MTNLKSVTLGGILSSTAVPELRIRRVERSTLGESRDVRQAVPGRDGSYVFPDAAGDREIVIVGWLAVDTPATIRAAIHKLAAWTFTDGETPLIVSDESDRYYQVTYSDVRVNVEDRYPVVEVMFDAGAYALSTATSTQTLNLTGGSPKSGTFSIADTSVAIPEIAITPTDGTITSFVLTVNGETLAWSGALADDATLTISSISQTVTTGISVDSNLTGSFDTGLVDMASVSASAFPELIPGSNAYTLSWFGTATAVTVVFTWRERLI